MRLNKAFRNVRQFSERDLNDTPGLPCLYQPLLTQFDINFRIGMASLPLLPGYTFQDITVTDYKLPHKLDILNGFPIVRDTKYGIGRRPTDAASVRYADRPDPVEYDPSLTYGRTPRYAYRQFAPHYALFAQKCLCFRAFFRQGVFNSPDEHYRIRYVNIIYYLEDDTICVTEPVVKNAGFEQGRLVRRDRIPKNANGNLFGWKDLNVGIDVSAYVQKTQHLHTVGDHHLRLYHTVRTVIEFEEWLLITTSDDGCVQKTQQLHNGIYGVVYHIFDCDSFTREFLTRRGIDVGERESPPVDPYAELRNIRYSPPTAFSRSTEDDVRRRFLEYGGMVLSFDATWNDDRYQVLYFLADDTVAIREIHTPNDGKDPVAMLLRRMRVPKNWRDPPSWHPSIYMEFGDPEVVEYYTPRDFRLGETISLFNRQFLLHDCDAFTRKYYSDMLGAPQPSAIPFPARAERPVPKYQVPPHIMFGTPEDTYASCLSLLPKPPKKDVIRQLANFSKKLRYSARMDAVHPEDEDRDFVLEYSLSNGAIRINEIEKRNSGRREGCFLSSRLIPKPGRDDPTEYYTPKDLFIGALINVFNHRFVITGADLFVYRYVEANSETFGQEVRDNLRNYFLQLGMLQSDMDAEAQKVQEAEDEQKLLADNAIVGSAEGRVDASKYTDRTFDTTDCKELTAD